MRLAGLARQVLCIIKTCHQNRQARLVEFVGTKMADLADSDRRNGLRAKLILSTGETRPLPAAGGRRRRPSTAARFRAYKAYVVSLPGRVLPVVFTCAVLTLIAYGWIMRKEGHLTAESGPGYWLGIAGATMMLMLLLYPLRKRLRFMGALGRVTVWFRAHMLLGIIGPLLIVFHANFKLGSMNSASAFLSMLAVALSGLVGRFLYARIHMGLYGQKAQLQAILDDAHELKDLFGPDMAFAPAIHEALQRFEHNVLAGGSSLFAGMAAAWTFASHRRHCRRQLIAQARRIITRQGELNGLSWRARRRQQRAARYHIDLYFTALRKAARLAIYERLFGLWHILHLPLFFVLVFTAIVHVIAVHLY